MLFLMFFMFEVLWVSFLVIVCLLLFLVKLESCMMFFSVLMLMDMVEMVGLVVNLFFMWVVSVVLLMYLLMFFWLCVMV